jgi:DNA-binding transcriptional LysR family regulator
MLKQLRQRYKDFNLHFDILPREQVTDYLLFERGEYALTVFDVDHPNVISECIGKGRMICAVHENHPVASAKRISVAALRDERVISFQHDTAHAHAVRDLFQQAGVELHVSTQVRFAETAMALAQQELGVAIVDEFTATHERYPDVRFVDLVEESFVPVYINRGRFTPRSAVGDAFSKVARKVCADWVVGSPPRELLAG